MAKKSIPNVTEASAPDDKPWRFKPGNPGGPGRPVGSRNKLSESFLEKLAADWEKHGEAAIAAARELDPGSYVRTIASLLPKQVDATITDHKFVRASEKASDHDWKAFLEYKQAALPEKPKAGGNGTTH